MMCSRNKETSGVTGLLSRKIIGTTDATDFIKDGMTIGISGYSMAGYPKAIIMELVQRRKNGATGSYSIISGANVPWVDELLSGEGMIASRAPMCSSRVLSSQVNSGKVVFKEQQMCKMPTLLPKDAFGHIDIAIIEALGFDNQGRLIPTTSVGMNHHLMDRADAIIIEVNEAQPWYLRGLHDIHIPHNPPHRKPIPLLRSNQRIGADAIEFDHRKVIGIVKTAIPEYQDTQDASSEQTRLMAEHLRDFLVQEYAVDCGGTLPPIQTGFGAVSDAIAHMFDDSPFQNIHYFCGGVSEPVIHMLANGKVASISTGGVVLNARVDEILRNIDHVKDRFVLRNGDITNSAEVVARLGLVALNTGIEIDIYGNVNSSHIHGSTVVNGIGGGADFAHNADLSIILIPSTAKLGSISCIVPMASHIDICEHDVDVVITEHGVADVRGLDDIGRAEKIIENCTGGVYQNQLATYLRLAVNRCGAHHPQLPLEAFDWFERMRVNKTMVEQTE